jgi:hemerythrin
MAYMWFSSYETGIAKIDEQHRQLFDTLNGINDAFRNDKGSEELFKTLEFLTNYTVMHFNTEEELQEKYNYPDYAAHKQMHESFKTTVLDFIQRLNKEGPNSSLVNLVIKTIGEWLVDHIRKQDIRMTEYIKTKQS